MRTVAVICILLISQSAMAAITIRGAPTSASASGTTCTVNVPTGTTTNDVMYAAVFGTGGVSVTASGFTTIATSGTTPVGGGFYLLREVVSGAPPASIVFTITAGNNLNACELRSYTGVNTTTPEDTASLNPQTATNGTSNTTSVAGFTTVQNGDWLVFFAGSSHSPDTVSAWSTPTSPGTFGHAQFQSMTAGAIDGWDFAQASAGGTGATASTCTTTGTCRPAAMLVAIQPAGAGPVVQNGEIVVAMGFGVPTPAPTATASPPPTGMPTPIPLASPVFVVAPGQAPKHLDGSGALGCTTAGDGSTDDANCIQSALNAGDLEIKPGLYFLGNNPGGGSTRMTFPSNRNIRGCSDPNGDCSSNTNNYCPSGSDTNDGSVVITQCAGRPTPTFMNLNSSTSYHMFFMTGVSGISVYGMQFREANYNVNSPMTCMEGFGGSVFYGNPVNGARWIDNDFNGTNGFNGSITFAAPGNSGGSMSNNNTVAWNTFEHGGRGIEVSAANNNSYNHNISVDTSESGEMLSTCYTNTNNVFDHETVRFVAGSRAGQCVGNNGNTNNLTAGVACHQPSGCPACPSNYYATDTVSNSLCDSIGPQAWIWNGGQPPGSVSGGSIYTNDTATGACTGPAFH